MSEPTCVRGARALLAAAIVLLILLWAAPPAGSQVNVPYEKATEGTRYLESRNGQLVIKVLVEEANLGSGEAT